MKPDRNAADARQARSAPRKKLKRDLVETLTEQRSAAKTILQTALDHGASARARDLAAALQRVDMASAPGVLGLLEDLGTVPVTALACAPDRSPFSSCEQNEQK